MAIANGPANPTALQVICSVEGVAFGGRLAADEEEPVALPRPGQLHGCTQSPDDFATGTRMNLNAEDHNCFVAYPAQAASANASKCWNWFRPGDQERGQGGALADCGDHPPSHE
jgi:poly(3-hydroxybutyrate) depolymerase